MFNRIAQFWRLIRAGRVIARHGGLLPPERRAELIPAPARLAMRLMALGGRKPGAAGEPPVARALAELGPSYIKLGQFLATRADIVGPAQAAALAELQDRMEPFPTSEARREVERGLGSPVEALFESFGEPVAAASIAQVHRARTRSSDGRPGRDVAVKVLRPGVEARFARDLDSFFLAARTAERVSAEARRLRPVEAVATLARSVKLEMDLRLEAAAMSELALNSRDDVGFRVPQVDWQRTSRRVLTSEWIDGIKLSDVEGLRASGTDLARLGDTVIQSFLRHAIRDGFFHADMHQGNLFLDPAGNLAAVDFGIMGRLSAKERRFLAEILWGFIRRDYRRVAEVHFEAGYVPASEDPQLFAQALRAIGEPIMDREAEDISMARLLTQLFEVTGQFNMQTQPQLILLQKTMVVVEGVARSLNPRLNMWVTAEPVVGQWIEARLGPQGRIEDAAEGAATLGRLAAAFPEVLHELQATAQAMAGMARGGGLRLDAEPAEVQAARERHARSVRIALWVAALALATLAVSQLV